MRTIRRTQAGVIRRLRTRRAERGSAVIEFVVLGVILTLPVFYLVLALARLQAGAYAVTTAAREAGRTYVTAPSEAAAPGRAQAAGALAFADQGFDGEGSVQVACAASPCLQRDAKVRTVAALDVRLPLMPDLLEGVMPTSIRVTSEHEESVDRFGEQP